MAFPTSPLSFENVLRDVHDPATQTLRTTASATIIVPGGLAVAIDHADDSIRLGDGTTLFTSTTVGPKTGLDVSVFSSVLPTNAATESTLSAINTKIVTTIDGIKVDGSAVIQPISATSLPLPTGAATETTLSSINTKLPNQGQALMSASIPVVIAFDQSPLSVELEAFTGATPDNVQTVGSIDGTKTGTKYGFVNNLKQQILASHDRQADFTYADFGTKDERITQIDYSSPTFPGFTARRQFVYTLVSGKYRRDDEIWSIV